MVRLAKQSDSLEQMSSEVLHTYLYIYIYLFRWELISSLEFQNDSHVY